MRGYPTLRLYLLRLFLPFLAGATGFFILILELIDLFANLWRYMSQDVPLPSILRLFVLYMPTCLAYALPVALLFATAYTLGSLYARNELIAVFCAGVKLNSFVLPLLVLSIGLSAFSYFFQDGVVLRTYKAKADYSRSLLGQKVSLSNADVAVIAKDGRIVYRAEYYDEATKNLSGLTIVERDAAGSPTTRIEAVSAHWEGAVWVLNRARRFDRQPDGSWMERDYGVLRAEGYDEPPATFRSQNRDAGEMSVADLVVYVASLRRAGLPYQAALAERHKRLAFSFAPFVVVLISSALGSRFRKNVLLMSLMTSLLVATAYYVTQMVTMLMAKTGILPPQLGAWLPLGLFAVLGAALFRWART
jgi:lipopolysaccharide export system permease protein